MAFMVVDVRVQQRDCSWELCLMKTICETSHDFVKKTKERGYEAFLCLPSSKIE